VCDGSAHMFDAAVLLTDDGGRYREHKRSAAANTVTLGAWTFRSHQVLIAFFRRFVTPYDQSR